MSPELITALAAEVEREMAEHISAPSVEDIQNAVVFKLMTYNKLVAMAYSEYRQKRAMLRKANTTDEGILSLIERDNEEVKQENSNKNPVINSVQRDYMAGEVSKDLCERFLVPEDIWDAHKKGIIHFHDSDYFAQHMHNCCLVNLEDMLQNGTVISETMIVRPHSFYTACNIATQIVAQVASSQYGGQTISLAHLVPFVDVSRQKYRKDVIEELASTGFLNGDNLSAEDEARVAKIVEARLSDEIRRGIQTIQYQLVTLMTTNGQTPFVSVFMYLNECKTEQARKDFVRVATEVLKQRIQGVQNEQGAWITPAFPKLLYVLTEENVREGSEFYELTKLAAQCTAKRMVPDYISEKKMLEMKAGNVYGCMGCRSFLTVDRYSDRVGNISNAGNFDEHKGHVYYGRFNQGVVTLNLVDVACSAKKDMDKFWEILDERLELCHKALRIRHERLLGTPSDVAPILWQHGALARLKKGETIDKLLYDGYSTLSLGYAGVYEMTYYMTGKSHVTDEGKEFALKVMQKLNDACTKWKAEENIDYSVYGTPLESTTYKFAKCLQKRFGMIPEVTDRNYITNSYHVNVREKINAFDKLAFEAPFQKLSPGGAISYVEVPNLQNNIEAVLAIMQFIYENIMYAELNTKSDYCMECGYDGEIQIVEEEHSGKLVWECPCCGNRNQDKMSVARRTCGYIGTQFWNQGRTQEIRDRVMHLGNGANF
jgi:ribonucleoside-triphosphate reductase